MAIIKKLETSDTLVIAATGFSNKLDISPFDFFEKSSLSHTSKIIITDPSKRKTLGGLAPDYPSFFHFVEHLQKEIGQISPKQLIVTGTSGGAHTALLLGHLLKANYVVAFAPYPYLSFREMEKRCDPALKSFYRVLRELDCLPNEVKTFLDLRDVLSNWNGITHYYVHVSQYHEWDYRRAKYLDDLPKLSIITHPFYSHAVASLLSRYNHLKKCFEFPYQRKSSSIDLYIHLESLTKRFVRKRLNLRY